MPHCVALFPSFPKFETHLLTQVYIRVHTRQHFVCWQCSPLLSGMVSHFPATAVQCQVDKVPLPQQTQVARNKNMGEPSPND